MVGWTSIGGHMALGAAVMLATACGQAATPEEACESAVQQVVSCLDPYCGDNPGAFCRCYAQRRSFFEGGCECEDPYSEDALRDWVCEATEFEEIPDLDCAGLRASVRRLNETCP